MRLVLATRKSQLALAQARAFVRTLVERHQALTGGALEVEELHVVTTGDRVQDRPLAEIGGKGLFIKEIEEAILDRRATVAVHSLKDVPAELADGLRIGCVPTREDARDALVSRSGATLHELPLGARVGTSSLRRRVQLAATRPDLAIVPLRGNVDTRLRKCAEGEVDAVVLAAAGLRRLGLEARITELLAPELCLPAVGQGALAVELRTTDEATLELLRVVHDSETAVAVAAERGVMLAVEGSCQLPVAAYALREANGGLWLRGFLAEPDGTRVRRAEVRAPWPASDPEAAQLGLALGNELRG